MAGRVRVVHCRSVGIFFWLGFRNRLSPGRDHKEGSPVLSARFGEQIIAPDNGANPCKLSASSLFGLRRNRELDSQAIIPGGTPATGVVPTSSSNSLRSMTKNVPCNVGTEGA